MNPLIIIMMADRPAGGTNYGVYFSNDPNNSQALAIVATRPVVQVISVIILQEIQ